MTTATLELADLDRYVYPYRYRLVLPHNVNFSLDIFSYFRENGYPRVDVEDLKNNEYSLTVYHYIQSQEILSTIEMDLNIAIQTVALKLSGEPLEAKDFTIRRISNRS